MTARHKDRDFGSLQDALRFILRQFRKTIATALPAKVVTFDPATRRATIQPAVKIRKTTNEEVSRPLVPNVPILFPSGGGYILTFPLAADDMGVRFAAERGLTELKKTYDEASPDPGAILESRDALFYPGLGPLEITPVGDGVVLQSVDGEVYVEVHTDRVRLKRGDKQIDLDDDGATVTGDLRVTGNIVVDGTGNIDEVEIGSHSHKYTPPLHPGPANSRPTTNPKA